MIEDKTKKNKDSFRRLKEYIENIPAISHHTERNHYLKLIKKCDNQELNELILSILKKYAPFDDIVNGVLDHLEFTSHWGSYASQEYGSETEILIMEAKPFLNEYVYKAIMLYKRYPRLLWGLINGLIELDPMGQEIAEVVENVKRLLRDDIRECLLKYREFRGVSEIIIVLAISKKKSVVKKYSRDLVKKCLFLYNDNYNCSHFAVTQFDYAIRNQDKCPLSKMLKFFSSKEVKNFISQYAKTGLSNLHALFYELKDFDEKFFINFAKTLSQDNTLNCLIKYKTINLYDEILDVFIELGKTKNLDCILKAAELFCRNDVFDHISLYKKSRAVGKGMINSSMNFIKAKDGEAVIDKKGFFKNIKLRNYVK